MQHLDDTFERRSRHLVLVITLNYTPEYRAHTTLPQLRHDRDRFLGTIASQPGLGIVDSVTWTIEEGQEGGGLHLHMVIFCKGDYRAGIHYCRAVGEFWANVVTQGRGSYRNGNYDAANTPPNHLPWGNVTGQIDRNDTVKREGLSDYTTHYLCKQTQAVQSRGKHERTFGIRRY